MELLQSCKKSLMWYAHVFVLLYFVWVRLTALSRFLRCIYLFSSGFLHWYWGSHGCDRDHSVYAPSQWETALQSNASSHWQGAYTEWSMQSYDCPSASEATMKKVGKIDETPGNSKKSVNYVHNSWDVLHLKNHKLKIAGTSLRDQWVKFAVNTSVWCWGYRDCKCGGCSARPVRLGIHPIWWRWHGNTKSHAILPFGDV